MVTNYIYEIEQSKINTITKALKVGFEPLVSQKNYSTLNSLSKIYKNGYDGNKIGDGQYSQQNCAIKEVTGALKHVLSSNKEMVGQSPFFRKWKEDLVNL